MKYLYTCHIYMAIFHFSTCVYMLCMAISNSPPAPIYAVHVHVCVTEITAYGHLLLLVWLLPGPTTCMALATPTTTHCREMTTSSGLEFAKMNSTPTVYWTWVTDIVTVHDSVHSPTICWGWMELKLQHIFCVPIDGSVVRAPKLGPLWNHVHI